MSQKFSKSLIKNLPKWIQEPAVSTGACFCGEDWQELNTDTLLPNLRQWLV